MSHLFAEHLLCIIGGPLAELNRCHIWQLFFVPKFCQLWEGEYISVNCQRANVIDHGSKAPEKALLESIAKGENLFAAEDLPCSILYCLLAL